MGQVCTSCEEIARLASGGMKNTAIASKLRISLRTVQKIVKQWKAGGHVLTKPGRGRKRTVNTRRMRGIIKNRID
ncbi:hypothetical protein V3C99_007456, partial [Haemonchus contortus]